MVKDFYQFIKEYKVLSLAIAFIMGAASTSLINSLAKDVLMPLLAPLLVTESWKDAVLDIGPIHIAYGLFLGELLNFLILAFIVFIIVKKLLKLEAVPKK